MQHAATRLVKDTAGQVEVKDYRYELHLVPEHYADWWRGLRHLARHFLGQPHALKHWLVVGVGIPEPTWLRRERSRKLLDKIAPG